MLIHRDGVVYRGSMLIDHEGTASLLAALCSFSALPHIFLPVTAYFRPNNTLDRGVRDSGHQQFKSSGSKSVSLDQDGKILHRDVSKNNIIITDAEKPEDLSGMLIDLDLAKELGSGLSGARHRTGTMEFMAIEVLECGAHTYRHDLESFFYVFLKRFKGLLDEFPPEFDIVKELEESLFTGTYRGPNKLYKPMIDAFDSVVICPAAVMALWQCHSARLGDE
ncbi:MAG: hypothetical protein M1840_009122 [Geoglossum simile]|nr:MAG: hypothetical protein M1840_009122 [Geoglossum simile]